MQQTEFTPATLLPKDIQVLSQFLGLNPTPDSDRFYQTAAAAGLMPIDIWYKTSGTTDINVMIAAAALKGKTQRLPPDPRLAPKAYPPLKNAPATPPAASDPAPQPTTRQPHRATLAPSQGRARATPWSNPAAKLVRVTPNPRKPGTATHTRYQNYVVGRTVAELLTLGCTNGDFGWDIKHSFIEFEQP